MVSAGLTAAVVRAQEHDSVPSGPAPILVTVQEMLKPGEEAAHAKLEADYAAALDAGKGSQYYLGMGAISGSPRLVFLSGYSSLEEMSDVHDYDETTLGEKLGSLDVEHSGTLSGVDTAVWRLCPELSNPGTVNLAKMRFMELIQIHVKLGRSAEFADVTKHIRDGWMKADPNFHYSIYQQTFGSSTDNSYLLVIAMKSLADLDKHHSMVAEFQKELSEDERKQLLETQRADYNSTESNLFVFTPSMSRLPESWTKDDLEFWKPKAVTAAPAKKAVTGK
jgi:hypothetical protein